MSDLALQLIAENTKSRATFLDLGKCGLKEIPTEIGELVWLESLSFGGGWYQHDAREPQFRLSENSGEKNDQLSDLGRLASLTKLQLLSVSDTKVADLLPLANLNSLQSLYVSGTKVTDISPLANLTSLRILDVSNTQITDLAPIANLTSLEELTAFGIPVTDLSPLANLNSLRVLLLWVTQVTDLAPLANLTNLQQLFVSSRLVADVSPLANLTNLKSLYLYSMPVTDLTLLANLTRLQLLNVTSTPVADFAPLANLTRLQSIDFSNTGVSDLSPLANLTNLESVCVSRTKVADLAPLANLSNLQALDVSHTQVADLHPLRSLIAKGCPVQWSSGQRPGHHIFVEECPLINPPAEIVKQGNEAILNYFRERDSGDVDYLYEAKMLILGEGGAGKTSLLRRLYMRGQSLPTEQETTKGIAIHRQEFTLRNGRIFRLNIWDFGGQDIYHATHQFFLTRRSLYLLLDDTRKDHKSVSDEGFKYWLELIDLFGGHSPVLIYQNEKGSRSKAIDLAGIKGRYDNVKELYAGNLEHADAADSLREGIEYYASTLSHIGEQLPASWVKVRADIEARANEVPHISQQEYFDIYGRHMEFDRTKALHLSRYLHDLGVFLHFQDDPLLTRTVILQNNWATEAVFRVLDDETVKTQLGRFSDADCNRLWRDSIYADMHPELLALMQRFELCYSLADSNPKTWLATQLLPPAKPAALTNWGKAHDMVLRYRYDFMPKGIISRLTVRLHRFVRDPEMAWVTGVLFERESTSVLVELLPSGNEIELRARGTDHKALLSVNAAELDALNDSFQGLRDKVDKLIPCNCRECCSLAVPFFFEQKKLIQRKENRRYKVECDNSYDEMSVLELLDGIRVDNLPGWAKEEKPAKSARTIKIFLASSSELKEDRDDFDLYFRQQNDELRQECIYLQIVRWEDFLDAMSETRLQDEYNKAICECDVFISLFFTKTGKFTEEEFDTAHRQFKAARKPLIYTFFKNADIKTGSAPKEDLKSLWAFQEKLKNLGHFHTGYDNIEHLKRQFRDQLDKLLKDARFLDGLN